MPEIGDVVFTSSEVAWEVYLPEVQVPCVRLRRSQADGSWEYRDVPVSEFSVTDL